MKMKLVLAIVAFTSLAWGQEIEHAPTVAQCQADQRLWLSELEGDASSIAYTTLRDWSIEMGTCWKVDPTHEAAYYNTYSEATTVEGQRTRTFIQRHQLWERFLTEDAAGKR